MKYVVIDNFAVDEIVANRFLQSVEFEQGASLMRALRGEQTESIVSPLLHATAIADGMFITGRTIKPDSRFLVIDEQQSRLLEQQTDQEGLLSVQKLLRFAKKLWQGLSLTGSERMISGTSKAVLFPPHRYQQSPFRIVIEREPAPQRLEKRGHKGLWLLVYKAGHEGGDAARELAELTNFRKAFDAIPELKTALATASDDPSDFSPTLIDQMHVTTLGESAHSSAMSLFRRFEDWLPLLTGQQRQFITNPIKGPARIEGAAGTGKTLTLLLKAIHALRECGQDDECHLVFVTHSDATKRAINEVAAVIDGSGFATSSRSHSNCSLKICTLSELCAEILHQSISESEFIDRDAMESKELQLLYIAEAMSLAMQKDYSGHKRFLSSPFAKFFEEEDNWKIVTMLQHEISVVIKGRASEDLDRYKKVPALKYGLPISGDADKGFVFTIFRYYQEQLKNAGQFDTDDVVLTTIGQLDTPIWRRRRSREGFDAVFIDETHLFNINELHLFHYFTKSEGPYPIIYSVDRSQAVGDKGWSTQEIADTLGDITSGENASQTQIIRTVFRSSPDIVNLAFSILSSGATLFTNFDNPLHAAASGFTEAEERLCSEPVYYNVANEHALTQAAFDRAETLLKELECKRNDILIVSLSSAVIESLTAYAREKNKPVLLLTTRGDITAVEAARDAAQWVIGHADFVGGLEFQAVVVVGVDGGRVPPSSGNENVSSKSFLSYVSHNRLYVAISRARYRVEMIGEKARGPSRLIAGAIESNLVKQVDL